MRTPAEIIEAAVAEIARSPALFIDMRHDHGRGATDALLDLKCITADEWRQAQARLMAAADARRAELTGGAQ